MIDSALIEEALDQYQQDFRPQAFTERLSLSDWYALFPNEQGLVSAQVHWPTKFPNAGCPGIYFIFNAQAHLLYLGQTERDVNRRLGDYFGYVAGRGSNCLIKSNMTPPWKDRPFYVRTIGTQTALEAPILERFLISALHPPENSR